MNGSKSPRVPTHPNPLRNRTRPETFKMFKEGVEILPEDMPVQMSAAGTEIRNYEFDFVYPDGRVRHVLGNARPLRDKQRNPRGSVSAFIDITERKRAEQALSKSVRESPCIRGVAGSIRRTPSTKRGVAISV